MVAGIAVLLLFDLFDPDRAKALMPTLAGLVLLGAVIPVLTLATSDSADRYMFGGAYAVDDFSLVLKAMFLLVGYVVVLLSTNYIAEGDYWESEYYTLAALLDPRHDGDGQRPRPDHRVRGPRAALDPRLHAGHLAQARPREQRGRPEVLPDGRLRHRHPALRHVARLRGQRHDAAHRHRRRRWPSAPSSSRPSPSAWCSCWWASPSRCRPCRSTPGRPTPTRAPPRRSPPSSPPRRRPPASSPC